MNFQVITTFLIYTLISFILTYYFNLFTSKSEYKREEFSNIFPQLGNMVQKIYNNYSVIGIIGIFFLSGITGMIIPALISSVIINSALLPGLFYFFGPKFAVYFEETRVTISDNYFDQLQIIYTRYYHYIITGFNCGFASRLVYNWVNPHIISFYWMFFNLILITFFVILILRDDIYQNL